VQTGARLGRLALLLRNRLVRQNLVLFAGGLVAGIGGFVYHAIAGRVLGPATYGQVAFLIAVYAVGTGPALILIVVLARYTAMLSARGDPGVRSLLTRTARLVAIPCLVLLLLTTLFARPIAAFEHLGSTIPILILGFSIALIWQVAIPRGILQGLQRFTSLSLNLSLELIVRTTAVFLLLRAGYAVSGAMAAVFVGLVFVFCLGLSTPCAITSSAPASGCAFGSWPASRSPRPPASSACRSSTTRTSSWPSTTSAATTAASTAG